MHPFPPVTFIVTGKLPVCVGVPLNNPVDDKVNPVGNTPVFKLNVAPPIAPVCVKDWLKETPAVPEAVTGFVTVIVLTVTGTLPEALHPLGAETIQL